MYINFLFLLMILFPREIYSIIKFSFQISDFYFTIFIKKCIFEGNIFHLF